MKYKVGDRVRIKSLDWYNKNKNKTGDVPCGEYDFVSDMSVFCGKILTIDVDFGNKTYLMKEDNNGFIFTIEMIEGLMKEETKPKFKVGDKVITDTNMTGKIIEVVEYGWYRVEFEPYHGIPQPNSVVPAEHISLVEEENTDCENCGLTRNSIRCLFMDNCPHNKQKNIIEIPEGYVLKDENGKEILTSKIILEKKKEVIPNLQLDSIRTVREYDTAHSRIWLEIYEDNPTICIFTHLLVDEDHRRKGYGTKALEQAEIIAKDLGCDTIHLKVKTDSWMHNWYLRSGYKFLTNAEDNYTWLAKSI